MAHVETTVEIPPAEQVATRRANGTYLERPPWSPPTFQPGTSGNPAGRPRNAGRSIIERMNDFASKRMSLDELRVMADNSKLPIVDQTAARRLVAQHLDSEEAARLAFCAVADYSDGKPTTRAEVVTKADHLHAHLITDAAQLDAVLARRTTTPGVDLGLLTEEERGALVQLCERRRLALTVDDVDG